MKLSALSAALVFVLPLATGVQAQSANTVKGKAMRSTSTRPVAIAKPAARMPAAPNRPAEAQTFVDEPLSEAQLALAGRIYTGVIPCELGASVTVTADDRNPGFFTVSTGKHHYRMHPVESRTGALRMEDRQSGGMWLQLGNKSMLMSQKLGQRLADECAAPVQREVAAQMQNSPAVALFDDSTR